MLEKQPAVYIITNKRNGTLYTGVTGNLPYRIWLHKEGKIKGFAQKYGLKLLAYYELHGRTADAIVREKRIKDWKRKWKLSLIEKENPDWRDLYEDIV
ncbi:MAG: GIY-YIG nuclease family protein [Gammaproteobacteria bacterium]